MQGKTKNVLLAVLVVGLVSMTVAYAAFSTSLTISSSAKVNNTKWEVKIDNFANAGAQANLNGGTSEAVVTMPGTTSGTTISGLEVKFMKPGDVVKFTFNLKNTGDIAAKLNGFTLGEPASSTKVTKEVKCGSTPAVPSTSGTAMNLAAGTGTIACYMKLTLAADATMATGSSPASVTIPYTVFDYGQN